jgi:molybdopterin-guanine dinucleotide biosynthesis protein B
MKRLHVVGRKNSGKTTLIVDLIEIFSSRGYCVGTIKHTHHEHELDTPGKDSYRHREAGSKAVGIISPKMNAIFWPKNIQDEVGDKYQQFDEWMDDCDMVLVEGDSQANALKIEVYRFATGNEPMAKADRSIRAVITDDEICFDQERWMRSKLHLIADRIESLMGLEKL